MRTASAVIWLLARAALAQDSGLNLNWLDEPGLVLAPGQQATLRVLVADSSGNAVSGVVVSFVAPPAGPSGVFVPADGSGNVSALQVTSGDDGTAAATLQGNGQTGPYLVTALAPGTSAPVTFGIANVPSRTPSPALAASAARRAVEAKLPAGGAVYGPVWLAPTTTIVSVGPPSLYGSASPYNTTASGSWFFWIDPTPGRLFGHPVQYLVADASRPDPSLPNARYTHELWWPSVRVAGGSAVALLPPPLPAAGGPGGPAPPSAAGNCAILLAGPAAPGAYQNAARLIAFLNGQGIADPDHTFAPVTATRDTLAQAVQSAADAACTTVYFHITANGFPPRISRPDAASAGLGGLLLQAGDGTAADFFDYADLATALAPLRGARLEMIVEASYAGNAAAALSGRGLAGDLLAGSDSGTPQSAGPDGTPLSADLLGLWQAALDAGSPATFAQLAGQVVSKGASSPATAQSNPLYAKIVPDGPRALALPHFSLPAAGVLDTAKLTVPPDFTAGSALTVLASASDPRIAEVDPHGASLTAGPDPARLTILGASAGLTNYSVRLSAASSVPPYQGTGTIAVGQEISCTPARISLPEFGSAQVLIAPGAFYDALFNGTKFAARSLDERTVKVSPTPIGIADTASGGSLNISSFFAGTTTVEVTGSRAWGPSYTACILDVTVIPASGGSAAPTSLYIQQTDSSMQRLTTALRAGSESVTGIVVPTQAAGAGSELVCSAGTAPLYTGIPATGQAFQKAVAGSTNAQAMCFWTPGASGTPVSYQFSTFLGGTGNDQVAAVLADAQGNLFVVGTTDSKDFPVTVKTRGFNGKTDVFVAKLSRLGDRLLFAAYLGGSDVDVATGAAVDSAGNLYVTGSTVSSDFPLSNTALPVVPGGGTDAFLVKLDGSGAIVYSTRFGGEGYDTALAVAVDAQGAAYISGFTTSLDRLPITAGAYQPNLKQGLPCPQSGLVPCPDAFVAKFSPDGSALLYATYLGGTDFDYANALAVDAAGNAYVAGGTSSADFPATTGTYQTARGRGDCLGQAGPYPCADAFVAILNPAGTALTAATFLGGDGSDQVQAVTLDAAGTTYLTGITSSRNFPVTRGAFQGQWGGGVDAFVSVLGPGLKTLVGSSYFGGSGTESPGGIVLGRNGRIYFAGSSTSKNLPVGQPPVSSPLP
jgi:hypothetical protein